jgi:probable rRNA maturation factor
MTAKNAPRAAAPAVRLHLDCLDPGWQSLWPDWKAEARTAARAALKAVPKPARPSILSLVLTNDVHISALNRDFRGKDKPTNVLSFPADDAAEAESQGRPELLGDVILARETIEKESANQNKRLEHHAMHLIVHGILHIFGYDHGAADEAEAMEALETRILAKIGIGDPYGR